MIGSDMAIETSAKTTEISIVILLRDARRNAAGVGGDVMLVAFHPRSASSAARGWLTGASHTSSIHHPDRVTPCASSRFSTVAPSAVRSAIACELVMFVFLA
jgi:hypothetical protein